MSTSLVPDRHVHARTADGTEVARYSRAGKFYLEPVEGKRTLITLAQAVDVAVDIVAAGGKITEPFYERDRSTPGVVVLKQYGGMAFDARFRRAHKAATKKAASA